MQYVVVCGQRVWYSQAMINYPDLDQRCRKALGSLFPLLFDEEGESRPGVEGDAARARAWRKVRSICVFDPFGVESFEEPVRRDVVDDLRRELDVAREELRRAREEHQTTASIMGLPDPYASNPQDEHPTSFEHARATACVRTAALWGTLEQFRNLCDLNELKIILNEVRGLATEFYPETILDGVYSYLDASYLKIVRRAREKLRSARLSSERNLGDDTGSVDEGFCEGCGGPAARVGA